MASIYKRGKSRKSAPYWIQYVNHEGKRKTVKGFSEKSLTEQLAAKLETDARLRKMGLIDPEQERLAGHRSANLEELLPKFEASLHGNVAPYIRTLLWRVKQTIEGCGFKTLADIQAEPIEAYLREVRQKDNLSARTYNHYMQAIHGFA